MFNFGKKKAEGLEGYIAGKESTEFERFHNIASSMILDKKEHEIILLTSAVSGEGKTTVALNLAARFASSGKSVLILDCNLLNPVATRLLGLGGCRGVSNLIEDAVEIKDLVSSIPAISVDSVGAGAPSEVNLLRLFSSKHFRAFLAEARERYEKVIIEAPAISVSRDFFHFEGDFERIVFVVAPDVVSKRQLISAKNEMNKVWSKDVMVILNRFKEPIPRFFLKLIWG